MLSDTYGFVPAVLIAGVIADVLYALVRRSVAQPARSYLFAFSVPVVFYTLYFLALQVSPGVAWSIHMTTTARSTTGVSVAVGCTR